MAVFATLFGKLAQHLSPDSLVNTLQPREATFRERDEDKHSLNHTLAIGSLGGATLD